MADISSCPGMDVFRLRVVIAGISPLIWRRLEVAAGTTVAGLHAIVQAVFGWSGEHLHRFVIGGTGYGISCPGGPGFRDDARQVRLAGLGLRAGERFTYEYNFSAAWRVDLRVEQIAAARPGRPLAHSGTVSGVSGTTAASSRGAGKNHAMNTASVSTLLNTARRTGGSASPGPS